MDADRLLDEESLHRSSVVANCTMNGQRQLAGTNGYGLELTLDVVAWLEEQLSVRPVKWLDVCCGTGTALSEAARRGESTGLG